MDLTMVDLGLLADPVRCGEAEPAALETARFFAELPVYFDNGLPAEQVFARSEFIRAVVAHWPAGPARPHEINRLVARYGETN
jgi:hypothetical protein